VSKWVRKNKSNVRKGDQQGKKHCSQVLVSVTLNSFLSLKAKGFKFCVQTSYVNAKQVTNQIFEILSGG